MTRSAADIHRPPVTPLAYHSVLAGMIASGLPQGRPLLVHTSLRSIGLGREGAAAFCRSLMAWVERGGTAALMPAFSYGPEDPAGWTSPPLPPAQVPAARAAVEPFDVATTPVSLDLGYMPEFARQQPGAVRSAHPTLSFCGIGPRAAEALDGQPMDLPLGPDSPLGWLCRNDGLVLMAGTGVESLTVLHLAETLAPVSYLRASRRRIRTSQGWEWYWGAPWCGDGYGVIADLLDGVTVTKGVIGNAPARVIDAAALVSVALARLRQDPGWLLCPATSDCIACQLAREWLNGRTLEISYGRYDEGAR